MNTYASASDETPRVFDVADFGAVPGESGDAGPGIRAAIDAAKQHDGPVVVRLGPGEYRVAPEGDANVALPVTDVNDFALEGAGAATRLVVTAPLAGAVQFTNSRSVRLAGLCIDYDPLPFTQGTVVGVSQDGLSFDLECDPGYPEPDAPGFGDPNIWGLVVSGAASNDEQFGPIPVVGGTWSKTADGHWRYAVETAGTLRNAGVRPGARYVHKINSNAWPVSFIRSQGAELDNVTVHAGPSPATLWICNEDVVIRGLRVERPAGQGRLLSTNADGIHSLGNRGRLLVEDCYFEAMADDGINIHARAGVVTEQIAANKLRVNPGGCVDYRVGDRLQLYDPDRGVVCAASLVVTEVEPLARETILTIDPPFDGINTGTSFADADHLFNLDACGAGAVIRNNVFGNHRGRGLLLKSTDCLIEQNVFRNREGWGVSFAQLQAWGEGPAAQRILIRDNTFEGQGAPGGYSSCILIRPTKRGDAPAEGRPVRDIRVENNRFINPANGILDAWAVDGLEMVDNTVEADADGRLHAGALVSLHTGTGFHIKDLHVRDDSAKTTAMVFVGEQVEAGPAGVRIEGIDAALLPNVPLIEDKRLGPVVNESPEPPMPSGDK